MTAVGLAETNNKQPPDAPLVLAHGALAGCKRFRAMGNGGEQAGGVFIDDAREARSR